jgi:hypothetical protein
LAATAGAAGLGLALGAAMQGCAKAMAKLIPILSLFSFILFKEPLKNSIFQWHSYRRSIKFSKYGCFYQKTAGLP